LRVAGKVSMKKEILKPMSEYTQEKSLLNATFLAVELLLKP